MCSSDLAAKALPNRGIPKGGVCIPISAPKSGGFVVKYRE